MTPYETFKMSSDTTSFIMALPESSYSTEKKKLINVLYISPIFSLILLPLPQYGLWICSGTSNLDDACGV